VFGYEAGILSSRTDTVKSLYALFQYFSFHPDFDFILAIAKESIRVDYGFFALNFIISIFMVIFC
jgi:hypothetical protein